MTKKRIAILIHKDDAAFVYFKYLIKSLMKEWEALGFAVKVIRGIDQVVPADVLIPHLDLTIVPDDYREFLAQYPVVINRHVVDISKSKISANLIGRDDPYTGPVIVKTDFNSGGLPEKRLSKLHLFRAISAKVFTGTSGPPLDGWQDVRYINSADYPVFPSLQDVPDKVFTNKSLVVEKFLPEILDGRYCVRYYIFMGDRDLVQVFRSKNKVVKGSDEVALEAGSLPPELYTLREKLGMDYGKIDFVIREGQVIVLDINRTPGIPSPRNDNGQLVHSVAQRLAKGIWSKL
jgi:hypothetical protein